MHLYGFQCVLVCPDSSLWVFMGRYRSLCIPMESNRSIFVLMENYATLWILMCPYWS